MKRLLILFLLFLPVQSFAERVVQSNGDISSDPVFAKLPRMAESINACLSTRPVSVCQNYLAKEDKVISGIQVVHDILPKLPPYTKSFQKIAWDKPVGATSTVKGEYLYVITGQVNDSTGKIWYLRYRFVMQGGSLKLYGIAFNPNKLAAEIPYTKKSAKKTPKNSGFSHSNGRITKDSNFGLLAGIALKMNACLSRGTPTACSSLLARDDKVISNIKIVHDLLPKLPAYTKDFAPITFDKPKGALSTVDGENLYVITGKTKMRSSGQKFYLRYRIVKQNGVLKVYGIVFSPKPVESMIPGS